MAQRVGGGWRFNPPKSLFRNTGGNWCCALSPPPLPWPRDAICRHRIAIAACPLSGDGRSTASTLACLVFGNGKVVAAVALCQASVLCQCNCRQMEPPSGYHLLFFALLVLIGKFSTFLNFFGNDSATPHLCPPQCDHVSVAHFTDHATTTTADANYKGRKLPHGSLITHKRTSAKPENSHLFFVFKMFSIQCATYIKLWTSTKAHL